MKEKKQKKKKTWWQRLLIISVSIVGGLGIILLGAIAYFRLPVSNYYDHSEKAFKIPGLGDSFVPQGMHYDEKTNNFFVTGYCSNDDASPVYLVNKTSGETVKEVRLQKEDGNKFTGHAGGIAVYDRFVYVAGGGDNCLYVFNYDDFFSQSTAKCIGAFSLKVSQTDYIDVSFVTVDLERRTLFVGEFYDGNKYDTLDSHTVQTKGGATNHALMLCFSLDANAEFGVSAKPDCAYSITNKVQGVCLDGNTIYFSTSYGLSFSHIYEHDLIRANDEGKIDVLGSKVPLYSFDNNSLVYDYKIPPMSEELVLLDGELYVMCESASNKYIFGKFTGGQWCYKTDLEDMRED